MLSLIFLFHHISNIKLRNERWGLILKQRRLDKFVKKSTKIGLIAFGTIKLCSKGLNDNKTREYV